MNITKKEAEILDYLIGKKVTFKEASLALGMKKPNLTKYIKKLERYRLVTVARKGQAKELALEYAFWAGFLEVKEKLPYINLSDLLVGATPFFLSFIKSKASFRISQLDMPPISAKRLLKRLRNIGVVFMPARGIYRLRAEALPAAEFCRKILMQAYAAESEQELGGIVQAFFSFDGTKKIEAVFITDREVHPKNYWPTGYSVFHKYGVRLILSGKFYYSNIKPKLEDVVIQALATGKDARSIAFVVAVMLKNKFKYDKLLKKKQRFDLPSEFIQNLIEFSKSKGEKTFEGFPSWEEVEGVAYG